MNILPVGFTHAPIGSRVIVALAQAADGELFVSPASNEDMWLCMASLAAVLTEDPTTPDMVRVIAEVVTDAVHAMANAQRAAGEGR